jgi:PAS domain S-box-containing protein
MGGRGATWHENQLVPTTRFGRREDVYWTYSYCPIDDQTAASGVGGVLVVCTETTETVLAKQRMEADQERQRLLLQQMPGFVAVMNGPQHVFQYVNDAYVEISGRRDFVGRNVREAFPELEGQPFFDLLDEVYSTGKAFAAQAVPITLDRGERFIDLLYEPIRDQNGLVTGIFVGGYDVTDAKRAERRLRQNQQRLLFLDMLARETERITDADALLATTTRLVGEHMGVSICAYADMYSDGDSFTILGDWAAEGSSSIVGHYRLKDFGALAVERLSAGLPLIVNNVATELPAEDAATFLAIGVSATICMPLVKDGRLTALMAVHDKTARLWTEAELSLIREVTERSWAHVERVGAGAELRKSEERYRALFNAMDEGFCVIEFFDGPHGPLSDYVHIEANPAYAKHAGIPNVVGQKVREMVGAEADDWVHRYGEVLRTGEPIRFERELEATGRWLELSAFRIEPLGRKQVAVLFQDLTARKQAENALRVSEANFRTLTRVMPNQAWTSGPDGMLNWFNKQVYDYFGARAGALDGVAWTEYVHPDDLGPAVARWQASLSSGETYEAEFRLRRACGSYRWHIARAVAIRSESGEITRWIGTNTDIHDQKEAAQALSDLNATLEQRVEERTSQLMVAEEALRQSQKMEAVGQLTGGLAHDFNNLLGGISGSLELLDKRLSEGRRDGLDRYIASAKESSRRAASLTQRLLAFSRRQTLAPKAVDMNRLVSGMEDLIRRTVGPTITVEVVGAGGLWTTKIDPSQLENSLLNLCINARDAMAPDGGRLTIETANKWLDDRAAQDRDLKPGQYVSLCVTDTGAGMTPEVIARAFDPFFTTKPLGEGTGLGLSMVYGFVRQSGGQVRIYSEVGKGTTMCLYLPRHHGVADIAEIDGAAMPIENGAGETVLVIDDEPILRMLMLDVLQDNGYRALEAADGASGLEILMSKERIDLLITDVGLPGGMNGRQVADAARKVRPDLKVLFVTGYAENAVIGNGHLDPGMEVMTKPFVIASLASKIRDMIES